MQAQPNHAAEVSSMLRDVWYRWSIRFFVVHSSKLMVGVLVLTVGLKLISHNGADPWP